MNTTLPAIHLCIVQPAGYVHSIGLLDQARYFRHQFRRLGATVSIGKNRLRHDAVNFIFGAHLGFDAEQARRHSCIVVNLEQLGAGGAAVSAAYLKLLAHSAVVDYDAANLASYAADPLDVPLVPFLHAPYLEPAQPMPLEERPIDLLFFGSMNERRRAWLDRIEANGLSVACFDSPLYGAERDQFIMQAKAVVNVHFYETSRFEQARVSHCLSLGTPVISERTALTRPHDAFEDSVLWLEGEELEQFFGQDFGTPECFDALRAGVERFRASDPIEAYADLLAFATGFRGEDRKRQGSAPWRPDRLNLGSGKDYQAGWLNIDILDRAQPDLLLDLALPLQLPLAATSVTHGPVLLEAASLDVINANNVLEHVPDLPALMGNCLQLLKAGGELRIEVPYEAAVTAWQDPTHVRALNENSWIYYCEWFWYLGWFEHRFELGESHWLDLDLRPCAKERAAFMRVVLRKVETTLRERTLARMMQADFGGVPEDGPHSAMSGTEPIRLVPNKVPVSDDDLVVTSRSVA